ncbi:hypothetical protein ACTQ49_11890 [Luteococcus sp. Sow4_B9]|uniref:hypothetical protein n=1 Tax=Luteococcus sp. Sow4_B9 TaxID=3438792 RepID=UPI003F972E64
MRWTKALVQMTLALMAACVLMPVAAAEAVDDGSVTIVAQHNTDAGAVPRSGIEFTIGLVPGVDPTTPAGRLQTEALRLALPTRRPSVTNMRTFAATDLAGRTAIHGLADGVYLVHETGIRSAGRLVADPTPFQDILVSLPMNAAGQAPTRSLKVMPKPMVLTPAASATPHPSQAPTTIAPATPRINSGGGADLSRWSQWLTILGGIALVAGAFAATRRSEQDEAKPEATP